MPPQQRATLRAIREFAPDGMGISIADFSDPPLYNAIIEAHRTLSSVHRVRKQILSADASLFAIPECNYLITSQLKHAAA